MRESNNHFFKKADVNDLEAIVDLHKITFSHDHFTSHFSSKMLSEYFTSLLNFNEYNYVLYESDSKKLIGFIIAGSKSNYAINQFIKKDFFKIIYILLKQPPFIYEKIIGIIKKFLPTRKSVALVRVQIIAASPVSRIKGIGSKLIKYFESELKEHNVDKYGLSVRTKNTSAIKFYEKKEFSIEFKTATSIYYFKILS